MNLNDLTRMIDASRQAHNNLPLSKIKIASIFGDEKSLTINTTANNRTATITVKK